MREKMLKVTCKDGAPTLDYLDVPGLAHLHAAGGDIKLVGRNLLQGMTFDSIHLTEESGGDLTLFALTPGNSGITVEIAEGVGALSVTYNSTTKVCVITLAAGGSSDDAIATAINLNAAQTDGYIRAVSAAAGNFTLAQDPADMTGGVGDYDNTKIYVGGSLAKPANQQGTSATAKWSDTIITCTTPAVGVATDVTVIVVVSNGWSSDPLSSVLNA